MSKAASAARGWPSVQGGETVQASDRRFVHRQILQWVWYRRRRRAIDGERRDPSLTLTEQASLGPILTNAEDFNSAVAPGQQFGLVSGRFRGFLPRESAC
jgi:hypothetical protein